MEISDQEFVDWGLSVVEAELQAILNLKKAINYNFANACKILMQTTGKVVVTGMGKSGHIGKKIAATLASTGTPSFFIHPGEALHGDLGMIDKNDSVIAISYSGESDEITQIISTVKRLNIPVISLTGNSKSTLAKYADCNIDSSVEKEACSLGLAPTSSTTAALVVGDALAVSLLNAKGFTSDDFARSHPAGKLGKKLLVTIADIMHKDNLIPKVNKNQTVANALVEMTKKHLGMTAIVDDQNQMIGIFTDGDLRRILDKELNINNTPITEVMNKKFISVTSHMLAAEAVALMEKNQILMLPVIDNNELVGAFNMHDLLRAGVV